MEIEVPGVGPVRPMNDAQLAKLSRHRKDWLVYMLACMCGRTIKQFKKLLLEQRRAVYGAYRVFMDPRFPAAVIKAERAQEKPLQVAPIMVPVKRRR